MSTCRPNQTSSPSRMPALYPTPARLRPLLRRNSRLALVVSLSPILRLPASELVHLCRKLFGTMPSTFWTPNRHARIGVVAPAAHREVDVGGAAGVEERLDVVRVGDPRLLEAG